MADPSGLTLGQYKVLQMIGQGGMARVYQGFQATLDRNVALKLIPARVEQQAGSDFVARFEAEAKTVAKLAHPYIVPIYDFGVDHNFAYLVMEFITGGSVRDQLARAEQRGQRLHLPWSLLILEQAAQALDFAHQNGIIHRDVKPGNMMLRNPQLLLLADFGVAKMLQDRNADHGQPRVVGTPQYMAPEQCRGVPDLDGRSDIYALGVVLYQCATGVLPFYADAPDAVMAKHMREEPPRPSVVWPAVPPSVERIILRALAKDPGQRYQRASEMASEMHGARIELEQALTGPGHVRAGPTAPVVATSAMPATHPVAPHGLEPHAVVISAPKAPAQGHPGAPGVCFRCGFPNSAANRHCITCGYDMAAHRIDGDRFIAPSGRPLRCRIVFRNGPFARLALTLHQDVTTVGRGIGNDVLLQDETVSRQHARLTFMAGQWVIEDIDSQNGVWVNKARVRRPMALAHGDLIRFGDVEAVYELVS